MGQRGESTWAGPQPLQLISGPIVRALVAHVPISRELILFYFISFHIVMRKSGSNREFFGTVFNWNFYNIFYCF